MIIALPPQLSRVDNLKVGRTHSPKRPAYFHETLRWADRAKRSETSPESECSRAEAWPDISGWGQSQPHRSR